MSLPIKLISTDFDGTIFAEFENPPIPPEFVRLIGDLQKRGAKWIINTGRDMAGLMEALARSRIPIQPDGLVLVEREIHFHQGSQFVADQDWNDRCARVHRELFERIAPDLPRLVQWINDRFHATVYEDLWSPICFLAGNNGDADLIHAYLADFCRHIPHLTVVRNDVYARLAHDGYNKGMALAEIARRWGITPNEIFAAGDHFNDAPMLDLKHARWLATTENAIEPIKAQVQRQGGFVSRFSEGLGVADALQACLDAGGKAR